MRQGATPPVNPPAYSMYCKKMAGITCHHAGQIVYPNGAKTLYIGNQEMSDESRNGF